MADIIGVVLEGILPFVNLILSILLIVELAKAIFNIGNPDADKDKPGVVAKAVGGLKDSVTNDFDKLLKGDEEKEVVNIEKDKKDHDASVAAFNKRKELGNQEADKIAAAGKAGKDADVNPILVEMEELAAKKEFEKFNAAEKTVTNYNKILGVVGERIGLIGQALMAANNNAGLALLGNVRATHLSMVDDVANLRKLQQGISVALRKKADLFRKRKEYLSKDGTKVLLKFAAEAAAIEKEIIKADDIAEALISDEAKIKARLVHNIEYVRVNLLKCSQQTGSSTATKAIN